MPSFPSQTIVLDLPNGDQEYVVCDVIVVDDDGELSVILQSPQSGEVVNPAYDETRQQDRETNWPWVVANSSQVIELFARAKALSVSQVLEQVACPY